MMNRVDAFLSAFPSIRGVSLVATIWVLALSLTPAQSQEWNQYLAFDDYFSAAFPGEPSTHEGTHPTEYGLQLPSRVYSATDIFGEYSVTVVDWRGAAEQHLINYEACLASVVDLRGGDNPAVCGNRTNGEIRGATLHAATEYLRRDSELTHFGLTAAEGVEGTRVQLRNPDGSHTYVAIYWHELRLYIVDATSLPGMPPPVAFTTSMGFIDEDGRRIRYSGRYTPLFPVPSRGR